METSLPTAWPWKIDCEEQKQNKTKKSINYPHIKKKSQMDGRSWIQRLHPKGMQILAGHSSRDTRYLWHTD